MDSGEKLHSKILLEAGRKILKPIGVVQKGRSRFWRDDRGWWLIGIEFQPSSWSRGSYLNVGCNWLWMTKDYFSYDVGDRIASFVNFQNEEQFRRAAEEMARRAVEEVIRYRNLFPTVMSVYEYYLQQRSRGFWGEFNAAIACALSNEAGKAEQLFNKVIESDEGDFEWVKAARLDAMRLRELAKSSSSFQQVIAERIMRTREMQKLPVMERIELS